MNCFGLRFVHCTAGTNKDFAERTHSHEQCISRAMVFFLISGANLEHFPAFNCVTVYARYCGMYVLASPKVIAIVVKFVLLALAVLIQFKCIFFSGHHLRLRTLASPVTPTLKLTSYF